MKLTIMMNSANLTSELCFLDIFSKLKIFIFHLNGIDLVIQLVTDIDMDLQTSSHLTQSRSGS